MWVWATRHGHDRVRARLGERYRTELATLAEAVDSGTTAGLIDPPAPADGVATAVVSHGGEHTHPAGDVVPA